MATYKVVLTVKDSSGQIKEINGGTLDVDLQTLTADELDQIKVALEAADFVTQNKLKEELDDYATETEVFDVVQQTEAIKYADFELID